MCFLRLSLVFTTFEHNLQICSVFKKCFASIWRRTSLFLPTMPHSEQCTVPSAPTITYWSMAASSSVSHPRTTNGNERGKGVILFQVVISTSKDSCAHCNGHRNLKKWMPKRNLLSNLGPHWRQVRPTGTDKWEIFHLFIPALLLPNKHAVSTCLWFWPFFHRDYKWSQGGQ